MNKASAFRIKQADGTYGDPIVFGLDKSEVWPSTIFIPANVDLNDYTTPGVYYCSQNTTARTLVNVPVPFAFSLQVYRTTGHDGCKQILTTYQSGDADDMTNRIYVRTYYDYEDVWSEWCQIVTSMDRPIEYTSVGNDTSTYSDSKMWHKVATFPYTHDYNDRRVVFTVTDSYMSSVSPPYGSVNFKYGILHAHIHRLNDFATKDKNICKLTWNLNTGYNVEDFVLVHIPSTNALELWTKVPYRYNFRTFNLVENANVAGGNRYRQRSINPIEMRGRVGATGQASYPTGDGYTVIKSEVAVIEQPSRGLLDLGVCYNKLNKSRLTTAYNFEAGTGLLEYFNSGADMTVENGSLTRTDDISRYESHMLRMPWDYQNGFDSILAIPAGTSTYSNGSMDAMAWRTGIGPAGVTTDENGIKRHTAYTDWFHLIDDRFTIDGVHVKKQHTTHYGVCSTAAATAAKTVDIPHFELVTGAMAFVRFSVTNSGAVASLTLNVSNTGAKPIKYRNANLSAANVLSANRTYLFVYDGTNWQIVGDLDTDNNNYDRLKRIGSIYPKENLTTTTIIVNDGTGYFKLNSRPFDITYSILETGAALTSGTVSNNVYSVNEFAIKNTQDFTMTQHKPVFIKGTLNGVMFTPVSNTPLVQTLPNTEDGYQYIYLGYAHSTSNIQLVQTHPIVEYVNGAIRPYHTAFATNADIDAMF